MTSMSFARAAAYYDATRALPEQVSDQVCTLLAAELAGRRRCLEIGVGTGRIALPLHDRGIAVLGLDLARPMLEQLVANAGGRAPFPVLVGDATRLPLATASCDAVVACHVLHLVPDWPSAIDEALRVLAPGGVLLVDFGGGIPAPWSGALSRIAAAHDVTDRRPGTSDPDELGGYLGRRAAQRALPEVSFPVTRTLATDLDNWEQQIFSWTWNYSPEQMKVVCDDIRRWALEVGRDLHEPATMQRSIRWLAYEPVAP